MRQRIRAVMMLVGAIGLTVPASASAGPAQPTLTLLCYYVSGSQVNAALQVNNLRTGSIKSVTFYYDDNKLTSEAAVIGAYGRTYSTWHFNGRVMANPTYVVGRVIAGRTTYDSNVLSTCPPA